MAVDVALVCYQRADMDADAQVQSALGAAAGVCLRDASCMAKAMPTAVADVQEFEHQAVAQALDQAAVVYLAATDARRDRRMHTSA